MSSGRASRAALSLHTPELIAEGHQHRRRRQTAVEQPEIESV